MSHSPQPPSTIYEATRCCQHGFANCPTLKDLVVDEWVENRLADFNLWAAGVGALAEEEASLDSRLSGDHAARKVIIGLVVSLQTYIEQCKNLSLQEYHVEAPATVSNKSSDDSDEEITLREATDGVKELIDELIRLGMVIRKASTASHLRKADYLFDIKNYTTLRGHLEQIILGQPHTIELDKQEKDWQQEDSKVKFDFRSGLLTPTQESLVNANLRRRNRFVYAKAHGKRLATPRKQAISEALGQGSDIEKPPSAGKLISPTNTSPRTQTEEAKHERTPVNQEIAASTGGNSLLTRHSEISRVTDLKQLNTTISKTAVSKVSSTTRKVTYPCMPLKAKKMESFTCPCCWRTLSSKIEPEEWQKHIAADLRPYTCLFEDCQIGDMLYVKKDAWEAHMNESHRSAPYGQCFACRETFNGPDIRNELEIHVKDAHRGIISDDQNQLSIAIEACMKTNPPSFAKCPLCHWVEEETLRMHLSDEHDYPNAFEDVSYWECVACAAAQCFQNKKDLENYCRHSHPGIDSEPISVLPSRNKQEYELQCSRCRAYRIFSSETELIEHANSLHEGITDEERLPEFVVMCGARYPQFDECCVICSLAIAQMPPPSHQFILDHIAEHIHSFALYSLPWTEKLDEEDSNSLVETDYFGEEDEESNRAWIEGAANDEVDLEDRDNDIIKSFSVQEIQSDLAKNFSIIAPNPDEIRIAIICALALEAVAVISLLDETYDWMSRTYKRSTGETTMTQTTGRVGNHHVVICLLPGMGVASTASVLNDLRKSYTGIELGLVVGICGASPYGYNQQEIILGDVTISKSVIQYHFGKQYPEGFWRKTDVTETLERRTREIRSFFAAMVTRNMQIKLEKQMKGHLVTLMNDPDGNWKYPGAGKDVLYESNYRHRHYNNDPTTAECICAQCLSKHDPICDDAMSSDCDKTKCSAENSVRRSRLRIDGDDYPSPVAHIGTLASTKTVVNSGEQRDTLAKKHGVIAFEAEGAVVWDTIPSIFIKGVCDYADCHKNKDWRNFAAATAAAYTKAILEYWEDKADSSILESSTPVTTSDEKSTPVSASGEASLPVVDLPKESRGNSSRSGL